MTCEKCGHSNPPNPITPAVGVVGNALFVHFLNHMTPDPGFYTDWHTNFWWVSAVLCGLSIVWFFVACGICIERRAHSHS